MLGTVLTFIMCGGKMSVKSVVSQIYIYIYISNCFCRNNKLDALKYGFF